MKIVNGKKIRDEILIEVKKEIQKKGLKLNLGIFVVGDDPVIENFIKYKKKAANQVGVNFLVFRFQNNEENLEEKIIERIKREEKELDGIIVQLPLPKNVNSRKILNSIPKNKDVDLLSDLSNQKMEEEILPPVTGAIFEILKRWKVDWKNKKIVILGKGILVGKPTFEFLKNKIKQDNLILIDSKTENKKEKIKEADILISGIGSPNFIQPEMLKDDVVLIDAGTSTFEKKIVGDIDYSCEEKVILFSRTPNGIGPITIALIYRNFLRLVKKNKLLS